MRWQENKDKCVRMIQKAGLNQNQYTQHIWTHFAQALVYKLFLTVRNRSISFQVLMSDVTYCTGRKSDLSEWGIPVSLACAKAGWVMTHVHVMHGDQLDKVRYRCTVV